ncbi:MAG: DNA translocase FtsK [Candidatus Dadabacteria bacterium]|nr:DNA translocase FtsK [Candidatus Dadabacteria bacterium]NIX16692.1 DNA translocase FtsK [Candidatus Dadabacteria bacterium]
MGVKIKEPEYKYFILREIFASIFLTLGLFSVISLFLYTSGSGADLKSSVGTVGLYISNKLGIYFGLSSFIFPIVMIYTSFVVFKNKDMPKLLRKAISGGVFLIALTTFIGLSGSSSELLGFSPAGGLLGAKLSSLLRDHLAGTIGSYLIVTLSLIISLIVLINLSVKDLFSFIENISAFIMNLLSITSKNVYSMIHSSITSKETSKPVLFDDSTPIEKVLNLDEIKYKEPVIEPVKESIFPQIVIDRNTTEPKNSVYIPESRSDIDFKLPEADLLDIKEISNIEIDKELIYQNSKLIEEKLKDFGVIGKVTEVRPGPVITMFEYKPAPGIKINKIASLSNDLAMGLSARSIRIIAPIPGKNVIGIEVPNHIREEVTIRELIDDKEFIQDESSLTLALGKDIAGHPLFMDLRKAPHLMIAGTTGSGKSVFLHTVITSMLYKSTPKDLKFIMIDPKMLELSVYEDLPHLLHPVVKNPKEAVAALKWAVREMEVRYKLLSEEGARDIQTYNKKIEAYADAEDAPAPLPYLVIIIDELADLMMIAPSDIKESITRLSQMARAAGIHLIVATQRPSADVVAGLIKANFPARVSFLVSSKIDSRIILDTHGAEQLLGKGDMLFLEPGTSNLIRVQGAFISESESDRVSEFLKSQATPEYNQEITKLQDTSDDENLDDEKDELYLEALKIISETGQASISMLQRKLKIGYNRAARIVEIMEKEGFIGQQESAGKPREVYIDSNSIKELSY